MQGPCTFLVEEPTYLVVNKPAGLSTQAPGTIETLETELRDRLLKQAPQKELYIAFPHRLDRPVSGALLVARTRQAARRFGAQFETRKVHKVYWALCSPAPDVDFAECSDYLRKIPDQPLAEVVAADHPEGKLATLQFETKQRWHDEEIGDVALLEVVLQTGRMHQIRIQLAHRGWPVLGDSTYGSACSFPTMLVGEDVGKPQAIALHARLLEFHHPTTGVRQSVVAPLPQSWLDRFELLRQFEEHS